METRIEQTILKNLIQNEQFTRKCIPFLKPEYFTDTTERTVFEEIHAYFQKYTKPPTKEALLINLDNANSINEKVVKDAKSIVGKFESEDTPQDWLVDETESWCKDRAIYIAVMDSIEVIDKKSQRSTGEIPELLKDALSVSFDTHIGHDQLEDSDDRFEFYHTEEEKIPFDLEYFNKITKGGLPNKTLNIVLAGTGVGKSLFMCHQAASCLMMNKNVLYITMEMSEERIAERIDANLLDVTMEELSVLPKTAYDKKMDRLKKKCTGKLIVKEYPTASANANHFRHLLQELRTKKNFKADVIYIDYLNICSSFRIRGGTNAGSYAIVKAIAEELRGLAVEFNVPIISATQTNRTGFSSSDIGLEDTSESFGLPATADFMVAISQTEELEALNQYMIKQLKNRYADPGFHRRFVVGVDKSKMRLFDVEQAAQKEIVDDTPLFDRSEKPAFKDMFEDFK